MPLINTSVPNLIQGVSQQPDATRFAGQCEEQENALSSVADGLKKRPNTRHIARLLTSAIDENSFVHFINRSGSEKYVVIHDGICLYAYNITTGNEATIQVGTNIYKKSFTSAEVTAHNTASAGNTTTYVATGYPVSSTYLDTTNPRNILKAVTVADSSFLLNTNHSVESQSVNTDELETEGLVFVSQGAYDKSYTITLTANTADTGGVTTPAVLTVNMSSYNYSYNTSSIGAINYINMTKRYRVGSVTVNEKGAGYGVGTATIQLQSTHGVYSHATLQVNMEANNNGRVGSVSVVNRGDYAGYGGSVTTIVNTNSGGRVGSLLSTTTTNSNAPTVTASTSTGSGTSVSSSVTHSSGSSSSGTNANTNLIAADLVTRINNNTVINNYFTASRSGSVIKIVADVALTSMAISTTDSLADSGLQAVHKEVDSISSLPFKCFNNFKVKVRGDAEISADDYYVKFETANGQSFGEGSWVETVGFGISKGVEPTSMPLLLINDAVDSFKLQDISLSERIAGDDITNPLPSFVANRISNIFFFKNRLGFLSGENVILSESGLGAVDTSGNLEYNFGRTTVTTLLDSDPIDISVASSRVTNLKSAKGFQENLILFSENGQFVLKGGDVLTPKTVSITPITNFSFEDQVDPLPLGSYIYFPFTRGAFTGMREFTVNASTDNYDSTEVTEHVPAYIPSNIIDMAGTTSEDMIVLLSGEEKGSLYIYNYFWNNNQKVLSAWSKFTFTGEIRGIEFIESTLYAVMTNGTETNLVEMPLESGLKDAAGYVTHLDMRVASTVTNGSSSITLPYTPADNSVEVYTTDGLKLNATNSGATVTLAQAVNDVDTAGNDIDTNVWVGIPYTMKYTFSEQLFKAKAGNGTSPSNAAKMRIRNGSINFADTAYFKVKVTPKHRDTYENVFTPDVVGSSVIGSLTLGSGFYRFPVFTKPQDTTITIENESALPSTFQSAEFESFVHSRSNRYG